MQIIAGARGRPLEIDALPEPGKSTLARLIVEIADVRAGRKIPRIDDSVRSEAGGQ